MQVFVSLAYIDTCSVYSCCITLDLSVMWKLYVNC